MGNFSDSSCEVINVPEGQGNINDTFIVDVKDKKIVLQRINSRVFPDQRRVADNFAVISDHLELQVPKDKRRYFPEIILTLNGKNYFEDRDGEVWRAQKYIDNTKVYEQLSSPQRAHFVGKCLGRFHNIFEDIPQKNLSVALPEFHNLPLYLEKYDTALKANCKPVPDKYSPCLDLVKKHRIHANVLERARQRGEVTVSVIHGDPKVSNVLFDRKSDKALTLIDFDTVGPGLVLHDIGDCLRSCCCNIDENEYGRAPVKCELGMIAGMLSGYFGEKCLSYTERKYIFHALFIITFELGLRFLTDYLQGDIYFKIDHKDDNLHRALVQFELAANIRQQKGSIEGIVEQVYQSVKRNR